jgi:HEAT repeat protein
MSQPSGKVVGCSVLFLVLSLLVVPSTAQEKEPSYKGRPVSAWIADLNEDVLTRRTAVRALAILGSDSNAAVTALAGALKDRNATVREAAFTALQDLGPRAKAAWPELVKLLDHQDPEVRLSAGAALSRLGLEANDLAGALARSPSFKKDVAFLSTVLQVRDQRERRNAAAALLRLGSLANDAGPSLIKALSSQDSLVAFCAALALGRMGKETADLLIAELKDEKDFRKRAGILLALSRMGPAARAAAPALRKLCKSTDPSERLWPAYALARVSPDDKNEAEAILKENYKEPLDFEAALLLAWLRPPEGGSSVQVLGRYLSQERVLSKDDQVLAWIQPFVSACGLAEFGPAAKTALEELKKALKHPEPEIRALAGYALVQADPATKTEAVKTLTAIWLEPKLSKPSGGIGAFPNLDTEMCLLIFVSKYVPEDTEPQVFLTICDGLLEKEPGNRFPTSFVLKRMQKAFSVPSKQQAEWFSRHPFARELAGEVLWLIDPDEARKLGIPKNP